MATPSQSLVDLLVHRAADPDSFVCFGDVAELLEALQQKGIGIGLISNAFPSARYIMDKLGLMHWFTPACVVVRIYEVYQALS